MNNAYEIIKKMTIRSNEIEKQLRKTYNARAFTAQYGKASIKDVASMIARKDFA